MNFVLGGIIATNMNECYTAALAPISVVESDQHLRIAGFWDPEPGCAPSSDHARSILSWSIERLPFGGERITIWGDRPCGRAQIDLSPHTGTTPIYVEYDFGAWCDWATAVGGPPPVIDPVNPHPVPESSSLVLAALGCAVVWWRLRR